MTTNRRKKNSRQRGSHTHGWGAMKKHRGSGNQGGHGVSGTGKRADSIKPSFWKKADFFGKHGFINPVARNEVAINVHELEQRLDVLIMQKLATAKGDVVEINLKAIGVTKLLGTGKVRRKMKVIAAAATQKAQEAVRGAGGEVILPQAAKPKGEQ